MKFFLFLFISILIIQTWALPISPVIVEKESQYRWPALVSQPGVKLLGNTCYESLLERFEFTNLACLKLAVSKALGLGIVVGGAIVKIPQIITILKDQSAQGLSLTSFIMETSAYEIVLMYNTRLQNPFSTYGEVLFMTIQNMIICLLIPFYQKQPKAILGLIFYFFIGLVLLQMIPAPLMSLLYALQIPIGLASKIPQIRANYVNQSTGQLSVFAVLNYFAGTTARAFTTWTELDDPIMLGGNLLASVLNGILVLQLILYWKKEPIPKAD
ncbi:hypothetical protein G6F46_010715 [Rhizopus delemar]|uniref:Mannose-P-dolichol utilization defect 1 protein homolog n=3 Tax=Rhizopus TaxID=4842 RepID=I1CFU7_RHIO9|nr:hypothetical protein RO3G_12038 [Rhizopus delemar RA 99-880]KAG1048588.1 hypothetical protein G6F43_009033 [Rhizopus delemar]KAG1536804.1 hypothetical protein G6F51_010752 [Rhizopus arrhizus]KAG1456721.1 hypothetical protein G6F55_006346 [Rhizopus delemar]KAG1491080.1 hypothetical protein G6F54_010269 [Rhizopus delemar]|eukprot:EIE87327.1 hypothetical protein RO3G_12038 [Rhizopus delemar RA 99-880]